MITFEALRKFVNDEKNSQKLVTIPRDFFAQVRDYLEKKDSSSFEHASAKRLLEDLLEIREGKILTLALYNVRTGMEPENMLPEEREFFQSVVNKIKDFQKTKISLLEKAKEPDKIILLQDLPSFVGIDLKTYGPLKLGDAVSMPEANARLLVEKGVAKWEE